MKTILFGLLIPFLGTSFGAACVFFLKDDLKIGLQRALTGFAAGVFDDEAFARAKPFDSICITRLDGGDAEQFR